MDKIEIVPILKLCFPFLVLYILFRLIEFLTKSISISDYSYNSLSHEDANRIEVKWFNASTSTNGVKSLKYRFKVNEYLIYIDRYNLRPIDRFKLVCWLIKERCLKSEKKELPAFLVKKYIIPEYTALNYNMNILKSKSKV